MRFQTYLGLVAVPMGLAGALILGVATQLQPNDGDLTRLGGYTEADFGWNGEQRAFRPAMVPYAAQGQSFDVIALGDSFTRGRGLTPGAARADSGHWTDVFAQRTGLRTGAFNRNDLPLETLIQSDAWRNEPPKVLILEYAERTLAWASTSGATVCDGLPPPLRSTLTARPSPQTPTPYKRQTASRFGTAALDTALDYIVKTLPRETIGLNNTTVSRFSLIRSDLFTNRLSSDLLIYKDDLDKRYLKQSYLRTLGCSFRTMQAQVEANGRTRFLLMIAPDRSTAYAAYLPDLGVPNLTALLAQTPGLSVLRLDLDLQAAAAAGMKDLYWPNDTHWAAAGKEVAGAAAARAVTGEP